MICFEASMSDNFHMFSSNKQCEGFLYIYICEDLSNDLIGFSFRIH
jgi:hypothetical protein